MAPPRVAMGESIGERLRDNTRRGEVKANRGTATSRKKQSSGELRPLRLALTRDHQGGRRVMEPS